MDMLVQHLSEQFCKQQLPTTAYGESNHLVEGAGRLITTGPLYKLPSRESCACSA